jgi:hypothetical protein
VRSLAEPGGRSRREAPAPANDVRHRPNLSPRRGGRGFDDADGYRPQPLALPTWIARTATALAVVVSSVFAIATAFVAAVMPYRLWDSLAFGSWSRSIAESGDLWANADALKVSRPLFYVPQGLIWRLADEVWLGRMFSAAFGAVLVVCVWFLARRLTQDRSSRALLAPLAVLVTLSSSVFATFVAAGMTDVPVAAATAATALVLWSRLPARLTVPLVYLEARNTLPDRDPG